MFEYRKIDVSNKINLDSIKNIERIILKWIWIGRYRVPLFILTILLLIGFSNTPYVSLFFNAYLVIFVSVVLAPFILDIDDRFLSATAIVLFALTLIVWFIDRDNAEITVNYIFVILFSAVVKSLFSSGEL